MEEERLNFVPYVISLLKSLDEEKDEKPSLPIPMIPDEVERSGPDEVIWVLGEEEEKEEETKKEKIPHMCESIGHRPLRGRCPKGREREKERVTVTVTKEERKNMRKKE